LHRRDCSPYPRAEAPHSRSDQKSDLHRDRASARWSMSENIPHPKHKRLGAVRPIA
jgi:hypothetical protein